MPSFGPSRIPRAAGLAACVAGGVPLALIAADRRDPAAAAILAASYLLFGASFVAGTRAEGTPCRRRIALLAVQSLCAVVMAAALHSGFEGIFLVVVAAQLVFTLSVRASATWAAALVAAFGAIQLVHSSFLSAAVQTAAYGGFTAFAVYAGWVAESEARQRKQVALLYAELQSTQALLAESSRLAERTRIARDLHDLLGHHLTALSLSLEVAAHVAEGRAREEVERARSLSKLLLTDLRGVVSEFREGESLDLNAALRALASGIPRPEIAVDVASDLGVTDPALAETLVRCAQELATNAAKHSAAKHLSISLARRDGRITLTAADDGQGAASLREGNGLCGMRERVCERGGTLRVETAEGSGFRVSIEIPDEART